MMKLAQIIAGELVIGKKIMIADSWHNRFIGLMGKKTIGSDEGLLLQPCSQIHTCFMRFRIDVVFLTKDNIVLKVIDGMQPWRISPFVKNAQKVLEMQAGSATKAGLIIGSKLIIK